tara:strand:- start:12755 stop:13111 length:357 start_codon:yes stop_codon:yes gene_type:complete
VGYAHLQEYSSGSSVVVVGVAVVVVELLVYSEIGGQHSQFPPPPWAHGSTVVVVSGVPHAPEFPVSGIQVSDTSLQVQRQNPEHAWGRTSGRVFEGRELVPVGRSLIHLPHLVRSRWI